MGETERQQEPGYHEPGREPSAPPMAEPSHQQQQYPQQYTPQQAMPTAYPSEYAAGPGPSYAGPPCTDQSVMGQPIYSPPPQPYQQPYTLQPFMPPPPFPGLRIKPSPVPPMPGQIIVAYQLINPQIGCCQFQDLSVGGWIAVCVLLVFFLFTLLPLCLIPFCIPDCYEKCQAPVYGYPPPMQQPYDMNAYRTAAQQESCA